MTANDYYQGNSHQQYQPYDSDPTGPSPYSQPNTYSQYGQPAPSVAPSYHSHEPLDYRLSQTSPPPQSDQTHLNPYSDDDPRKNQTRIYTNQSEWPSTQHTTYPLSPESQNPNPALLTSPKSKRRKKKGFFQRKQPWFVYFMTTVQVIVFVVEVIKNATLTGSPIMIQPSFNPMIGPSTYLLINMGARFVPCMRAIFDQDTGTKYPESGWPCPDTKSTADLNQCTLGQLCGMGGFDYDNPNQWYRFVTPIFLHAGLIHIGFNMLLQMTLGRDMERAIGSLRFAIVYLSSGIFGFVLGGNFAPDGIASTGASGCLFGVLALVLLDLLYTWGERRSPVKDLLWIMFDIAISFVLGLLPGLDNFAHIGGFLMGLVLGICILHSPKSLRKRTGEPIKSRKPTYSQLGSESNIPMVSGALPSSDSRTKDSALATTAGITRPMSYGSFFKSPIGFFKGRKVAWWAWWLVRAGCLIGVLIGFVVLLTNFYVDKEECTWCKYLSCLDITVGGQNWCDIGYINFKPA